jgi:hemerythrin-like metal-binding protein/PAS domain S-box-containing protein
MNGVSHDGNLPSGSRQAIAGGPIDGFDIFPWSSDFETGIGFMDEQHRTLVRLLNALARKLVQPTPEPSCEDVLDELSEYAVYHFQSEEELMRQYLAGDAMEAGHLQTHHDFVSEIGRLKALADEDPDSAPIERIVAFLSHWLAYHILDVDRRMAMVVQAVRAGTPMAEAKLQADRAMSGAVRKLIEAVLGMYDALSSRTLQLMKEVVERKRIEGELRAQKEFLAAVFENALDAVVLMNSRGIITGWNAQAEAVFGWNREEVIGQRLEDIIVPLRHRAAHAVGLANFMVTGTGPVLYNRFETEALHRDGRELPVELSITPIRGADGHEFSAFIRDITERKRQEAEMDQYHLHLEEVVRHRTADLTLAKEAAEAASRAKTTFLAKMSHELRTPMNGIIGMTDLALRRATDAAQMNHLDKVRISAEHLLAIINDLLDISKLEAERLTLQRMQFSLDTVLDKVASLFSGRAAEEGLDLAIDVAATLRTMPLLGDPLRLAQILMNLTGNAIKFTARGSITVRCLVAEDRPGDLLLRFEVADTGVGIPAEDQQRIFSAFEQADNSNTRQYGGTGLGLPICKRLATMMGGSIGVTSQPGVGSTFWFTARLDKVAQTGR